MTCTLCPERAVARGLCRRHYGRWQKTGDPTRTLIASRYDTAEERLRRFADLDADPARCWPWTGQLDEDGYGSIRFGGRRWKAHALSFAVSVGPVMEGLVVCHTCDNPPCVNPNHLFLGTPADNTADMDRKGRRVVLCGESNGAAKLTRAGVVEIRRLLDEGRTQASIASCFGVTKRAISKIARRETWKEAA